MNEFREELARFSEAMREAGERSASPGLRALLAQERAVKAVRLRWATVAAALVLMLGGVSVYEHEQQRQREAAQARADMLLMERVNEGLARPVPRAMAPLMGFDSVESGFIPVVAPVPVPNVCRTGSRPC